MKISNSVSVFCLDCPMVKICPHRLAVQIYNYNFTDGDVLITAAHQTMRATLVVAQVCCRLCKCGLTL